MATRFGLRTGQVAITIPAKPGQRRGWPLQPGDGVQVLVTVVDGAAPRRTPALVLERARVYSVGRDEPLSVRLPRATTRRRGAPSTPLTLAVTPDQARALAEARRLGELDVVLLPPSPPPAPPGGAHGLATDRSGSRSAWATRGWAAAADPRWMPTLDLATVVHCLAADQVLQAVEGKAVDAVVLAAGLHRLNESLLRDLERTRARLSLLAADGRSASAVPRSACWCCPRRRTEHAAPGYCRGCTRRTLGGSAAPGPRCADLARTRRWRPHRRVRRIRSRRDHRRRRDRQPPGEPRWR